MNHQEALPTKIDASPTRIPNTTVEPPAPHVLSQLEAPLLLLFPGVWVGVELEDVEDEEGVESDDNTDDNDEGGRGNEIDVPEGPTMQNL